MTKDTDDLKDTTSHYDLIDIYKILNQTAIKYIPFSTAFGMFTKREHILGHKTS